jgi:hypothetical protein
LVSDSNISNDEENPIAAKKDVGNEACDSVSRDKPYVKNKHDRALNIGDLQNSTLHSHNNCNQDGDE